MDGRFFCALLQVERGVPPRALWWACSRLPGKGKPRGIGCPTTASRRSALPAGVHTTHLEQCMMQVDRVTSSPVPLARPWSSPDCNRRKRRICSTFGRQ